MKLVSRGVGGRWLSRMDDGVLDSARRRAAYDNIIILTWGLSECATSKLIIRLVHNFNWILTIPTERAKAFILPLSQTILIIQVITIAKKNISTLIHWPQWCCISKDGSFLFMIQMFYRKYLIKIYYIYIVL